MLTESNATINASQSCVVQENYFFEIVLRIRPSNNTIVNYEIFYN